jgi:glycosyltransferase involved in cell wall biosynthesis
LRVLVVSDYYPPFIGGAHRQTRLVARGLAERGHEVAVATIWYPGAESVSDDDGIRVHRLRQLRTVVARLAPAGQHHQPAFPDPVSAFQLRRIIRSFRPDVVHAYGGLAFSAAAAIGGSGLPLVLVARDYGYGCPIRTLVRDGEICSGPSARKCIPCSMRYYGAPKGLVATVGLAVGKPILRRATTASVSVSSYVRETLRRDLFRGAGTLADEVIPSFREGADVEAAVGSPIVRRLDEIKEPFILFVGALRREKGIEELLSAYERIEHAPPLVLIGTLERDTPAVVPPGVVVIEKATIPEVFAAWDRSLFGVLPSRWPEPLGSVVYEGMSRGRAVIGTRPGGHVDMIDDDETGLLVPAGDAEALEVAMRRLIGDAGLRDRLGRAARVASLRFTAAESIPRLDDLLARVAGAAGG